MVTEKHSQCFSIECLYCLDQDEVWACDCSSLYFTGSHTSEVSSSASCSWVECLSSTASPHSIQWQQVQGKRRKQARRLKQKSRISLTHIYLPTKLSIYYYSHTSRIQPNETTRRSFAVMLYKFDTIYHLLMEGELLDHAPRHQTSCAGTWRSWVGP